MPITNVPLNDRFIRFEPAAGTTVFQTDFPLYFADDLVVSRERAGVVTTLILAADYTVTDLEVQAGATVTLTAATLAGDVIALRGNPRPQRSTSFVESGALPAASLNDELNRLVIGQQDILGELGRFIRGSPTDGQALQLPPLGERANRYLAFDALGNIVGASGTTSIVPTNTYSEGLLARSSAADARAYLGATPAGSSLFTASNAGSQRGFLGLGSAALLMASAVGQTLVTAPSPEVARSAIGANRLPQSGALTTASGANVDFTGLPPAIRELIVTFVGLSTNGTATPLVQLGTSAGFVTSGYAGTFMLAPNNVSPFVANITTGFGIGGSVSAADVRHGKIVFTRHDGNTWVAEMQYGFSNGASMMFASGSVVLPGEMDRIRFAAGGSDAWDAGSIKWRALFE